MYIYHNSYESHYRCPFGAAIINTEITLSIDVEPDAGGDPVSVFLLTDNNSIQQKIQMEPAEASDINSDRISNRTSDSTLGLTSGGTSDGTPEDAPVRTSDRRLRFRARINTGEKPGLLWYSFMITQGKNICFYGNNSEMLGGEGQIYDSDPKPYQITIYRQDSSPSWYREGIVYQIFPDRFARGGNWKTMQEAAERVYYHNAPDSSDIRPLRRVQNNWEDLPEYPRNSKGGVTQWIFAGGNLQGICEKLDYLKDLGITIIYLNPIFRASSNHKYDTADYMTIDEGFGTEEDFINLCSEAQARGIRIILDGVFNHTGCDSPYFDLFGRYGNGAFNNPDSPWYSWYTFTDDGYDCWWGVRDLPNVNEMSDSYQDFIYRSTDSVVRKWLRLGASGWRLDVADELPDEFIRGIRTAMLAEKEDSILMGEVWEDATNKVSYGQLREYFQGGELQSTMNYPFRTAALCFIRGEENAKTFAHRLMSLKENYPPENFYSNLNLIGSHDRARSLTEMADAPAAIKARLEDESCPLSDEEAALVSRNISRSDAIKEAYRIPEDKMWLAENRVKALSLLQFVMPGVPCIYYGDEAGMQGFEDPHNRGTFPWGYEDMELEEHYHFLCRLRKEFPVLINGDFTPTAITDHVICFERSDNSERFVLVVNRGIFEWEHVDISRITAGLEVIFDSDSGSYYTASDLRGDKSLSDCSPEGKSRPGDSITLAPLGWKIFHNR